MEKGRLKHNTNEKDNAETYSTAQTRTSCRNRQYVRKHGRYALKQKQKKLILRKLMEDERKNI